MNKKLTIFVIIGIIVIVGLGIFDCITTTNKKIDKKLNMCAKEYTIYAMNSADIDTWELECKDLECRFVSYLDDSYDYPMSVRIIYEKDTNHSIKYKGMYGTFLGKTQYRNGDDTVIECDNYE